MLRDDYDTPGVDQEIALSRVVKTLMASGQDALAREVTDAIGSGTAVTNWRYGRAPNFSLSLEVRWAETGKLLARVPV